MAYSMFHKSSSKQQIVIDVRPGQPLKSYDLFQSEA